jgi:aspartate 1-decarboxylase
MAGERGRGDICLNGPPARHFQKRDKIIILAEVWLDPAELKNLESVVVFVDDCNRVTSVERHGNIK